MADPIRWISGIGGKTWLCTELDSGADRLEVYNAHRGINGLEPSTTARRVHQGQSRVVDEDGYHRVKTLSYISDGEYQGQIFGVLWRGRWWVDQFTSRTEEPREDTGLSPRHARCSSLPERRHREERILSGLRNGLTIEQVLSKYGGGNSLIQRLVAVVRSENDGMLPYELDTSRVSALEMRKRMNAWLRERGIHMVKVTKYGPGRTDIKRVHSKTADEFWGVKHIDPSDPSCAGYTPPSTRPPETHQLPPC